ncbi:MAG: Asp-tRNA(Asn)/Glu-tRNA(Gln) amidotransferase subunit GatA [Gemmatimonadetes bacterium]|nr:Asp-tRNA(Asn)/Glu-tRNA(Gln) amidotransferase subunit GatA [Gemmatimonadota bacterium]MYG84281.1 Asp-tRNA(Asn)/Glu-tRNA(Gln) amidotransferase subunit GatA [Gemmatimonadota bacterium]MYJ88860.1 Asp-tRNA(Asn)/Glu-tRNA(Gln) amidotransferase subunit GatA [Gemmatimonadota bacterium]
MANLIEMAAHELAPRIQSGEVTAEEVAREVLSLIEEKDPAINAYLAVDREAVIEDARDVDRRIAAGETTGPLAGVPIAIKDAICTKDLETTCASRILEGFVPPYDATVIARLRAADAVIVGKTNMDQFGMGSSNENSGFDVCRNPLDTSRVPGGSSGGSAAALAAGTAVLALGEDTGGSIRQPAAFCGVVGLKPTYGRVSRYGIIAYGSSFDQVGPMARNVEDCAQLLGVIAGHDPMDTTSASEAVPDYTATLKQDIAGLRIGVPEEYLAEGLDASVKESVSRAIERMESLGARVESVHLPHTEYAVAAYYILVTAEASSNLARYDGVKYGFRGDQDGGASATEAPAGGSGVAPEAPATPADSGTGVGAPALAPEDRLDAMYGSTRSGGFGLEVKRRIMLGTYVLSAGYYDAYYDKAQRVRTLIKGDFDQAFEKVDLLVAPTTPTTAFRIGEKIDDPLQMYLSDVYTVPINLAGVPAISLPCGTDPGGMPIGLQIIGPHFGEERILRAAFAFEEATRS